jgi:hypothetical protein
MPSPDMIGGDKEILTLNYNALVKPIITNKYGFQVLIQTVKLLKRSNLSKTGYHKMSSQDHLLAETELLPISEDLRLICTQFLASASREDHLWHSVIK